MSQEILSQFQQDMQLRGFAPHTQQTYESYLRKFIEHAGKPPAELGLKDSKAYLLHLDRDLGRSISTRNVVAAALGFFFSETLGKDWGRERIPVAHNPKKLPEVLGAGEIVLLMRAIDSVKHRAVAVLCYGAGLRVSEAIGLRVKDIDSERGVIHIRRGKGGKQRQVSLSEHVLKFLRRYWRQYRPRGEYLFPGRSRAGHITRDAFGDALHKAVRKAGLDKHVTPHTLRHSYATAMIESGVDLRSVQLLLGHGSIRSTTRYVHLTHARMQSIKSPLDVLAEQVREGRRDTDSRNKTRNGSANRARPRP
jgi:site-specific recombinase XerD